MLYKNYWLCYMGIGETSVCAILEEGFNPLNSRGLEDAAILVANTKELISIENYKIENCREYLDENGLFMGMFPPEFLEKKLEDFWDEQRKWQEENDRKIKLQHLENLKKPFYNETIYNAFQDGKIPKQRLMEMIKKFNKEAFEEYGIVYTKKDYEPFFKKHNLIWE